MSTTQVVPALRSLQSYDNVGAHDAQSGPVNDKVQDAAVN